MSRHRASRWSSKSSSASPSPLPSSSGGSTGWPAATASSPILYLDRGSGFISHDTWTVVANLGRLVIHGSKGYLQGRGKIEKFNRTVLADVVRSFDRRPDVDPAPGALELRLRHYLETHYNHLGHSALGGQTPYDRFLQDAKPLEFPENREEFDAKFVVHVERRVTPDNVVPIESTDYEMPRGYRGQNVLLRVSLLDSMVHFLHQGRLIELKPVDLHRNARSPRARKAGGEEELDRPPRKTAADLAYDRDLGPVVDADGGFESPDTTDDERKNES